MALELIVSTENSTFIALGEDETALYEQGIPEYILDEPRWRYIDYIQKPNVKTAKALLKSLGKSEIIDIIYDGIPPEPTTSAVKGGSVHKERRGGGEAPERSGDSSVKIDPQLLQALAMSDLLHDVQSLNKKEYWDTVRKWFLQQCQPALSTSGMTINLLNQGIGNAWVKALGGSNMMTYAKMFDSTPEMLYATLQQWASQEKLLLVVDGLLSVNFDDIVETAILLLLLNGGNKIHKLRLQISGPRITTRLKEIHLMDGFYQWIDQAEIDLTIGKHKGFIANYALALQKYTDVERVQVSKISPIPPHFLTGYRIVQYPSEKYHRIVLPNGKAIQYLPGNPWIYDFMMCKYTPEGIHLPYVKQRMEDMIHDVFYNNQNGIPTKTQQEFIIMVAYLNFFRDAYKADLALQIGATLWTRDRLLFVLYSLLRKRAPGGHIASGGLPGIYVSAERSSHEILVSRM